MIKKNTWRVRILLILAVCMLIFTACGGFDDSQESGAFDHNNQENSASVDYDGVAIAFHKDGITVDGQDISTSNGSAVYLANDIVYYESDKDFTYGEGTEQDAHTVEEAADHRVVHITRAGTYILNGKFSQGQIAVDLGKDAKKNPNAVVTLVLNGVDISCEVAPAIIFYNVYECGVDEVDKATKDVDTSLAGANVIIADGTDNIVRGSYVARIYKPGTVELNKAGTKVKDAKKLHKYDAAFYSCMSMNISGGAQGTGMLTIEAENEGLGSELHLTIHSGNVSIYSGNDGINTNEDGVSVTTINGGMVKVRVTGETGEGDGIDSNGWLVINGGTVIAEACSHSMDAGVDSDIGIHVNGGTLMATGHMLDQIEDGGQTFAVFHFAKEQQRGQVVSLKAKDGSVVMEYVPENNYSILVLSSPDLTEGIYTLWSGDTQVAGQGGGIMNGFGRPEGLPGGMRPEGENPPEFPQGQPSQGESPQGEPPQGAPSQGEAPQGRPPQDLPQNDPGQSDFGRPNGGASSAGKDLMVEFRISTGANMFTNVSGVK